MQLSEIMYESWDKLQSFILDLNEEWSYKCRSKHVLRRNIFDKVDEISHSYFFLLQTKGKRKLCRCIQTTKVLRKYWRLTIIKFACYCKHSTIYSQQKHIQFLIIMVVIRNINYLLQIFRPVPGWYRLSFFLIKFKLP